VNQATTEAPAGPGPSGIRPGLAVIIFIAAVALRIPGLNQSLDYDEIWADRFFHLPWRELFTVMSLPNHHPLYSALAKLSLLVAGDREWALRLPAAVCGSLAPVVLYRFGTTHLNHRVGLIAAALMTVSVTPIVLSQSARGYAVVILLSLLLTDRFLALAERWSISAAALYLLLGAAALYTHMYAGALLGAHLLAAALMAADPARRRRALALAALIVLTLAAALLAYWPMLPDLIEYARTVGRVTAGRAMSPAFLSALWLHWTAGQGHPWLALVPAIPALAGAGFIVARRPILAAIFLTALAVGLLVPAILGVFVYPRFYCWLLPFVYLCLAVAVDRALGLPRLGRVLAAAMLVLTLAALDRDLFRSYRYARQDWRGAAEWDRANAYTYPVIAAGMAAEVFRHYCRQAMPAVVGSQFNPDKLHHVVIVYSFPGSVGTANLRRFRAVCGEPTAVFPSSVDPAQDVYVLQCR
jgi:mannosyltransferase